jgi:alpha-amylase
MITLLFTSCITAQKTTSKETKIPFVWEAANVYFLLTDRFNDGDKTNDNNYNRNKPAGKLRGFEGGDIRGVILKIDEGYFNKLGINVIWLSPIVEQIHDAVDEGTGLSYGFHGYWARDWSAIDANFGTKKDLAELVEKAHKHGIRIMLDAVVNHTGPVTSEDSAYPNEWVRNAPKCTYKSYDTYINCTLVDNLPDVKTESNENVELPPFLIEKWQNEGRFETEIASLNSFFKKTGFPKAPRFYIMKWLSDYIREYGIDGYRIDTAKHTYENVWSDFRKICDLAFAEYKNNNPKKVLDNNPFFMVGEVYGYNIGARRLYDFGDRKVDYFANGFTGLINFDFRNEAKMDYEPLFSKYSTILNTDLKGKTVMNYISSHDDSSPYDINRTKTIESGTKLLLSPGISQVYYGDETARSLVIEGTKGDATLRSKMNWNEIKTNTETQKVLLHWQKLGQFRRNHPAIGAGIHNQISSSPYVFSRTFTQKNYIDKVIIGLDLPIGQKEISIGNVFKNGTKVRDAYSGQKSVVFNNKIRIFTSERLLLIEKN